MEATIKRIATILTVLLLCSALAAAPNVVTLIKGHSYADPVTKARVVVDSAGSRMLQVSIKPNGQPKVKVNDIVKKECIAWQWDRGWRNVVFLDWQGKAIDVIFSDGRGTNCYEPFVSK